MKAFFDEKNLVIKAENYAENIALDTWAETFFSRVDLNKELEEPYYLLLIKYNKELDNEQEYRHDPSKA